MVIHQTVGVTEPVEALAYVEKSSEKRLAVGSVPKNRFALISPRSDVIQRSVVIRFVMDEPWLQTLGDDLPILKIKNPKTGNRRSSDIRKTYNSDISVLYWT